MQDLNTPGEFYFYVSLIWEKYDGFEYGHLFFVLLPKVNPGGLVTRSFVDFLCILVVLIYVFIMCYCMVSAYHHGTQSRG